MTVHWPDILVRDVRIYGCVNNTTGLACQPIVASGAKRARHVVVDVCPITSTSSLSARFRQRASPMRPVDILDPLELPTDRGNSYVLEVVDYLTK